VQELSGVTIRDVWLRVAKPPIDKLRAYRQAAGTASRRRRVGLPPGVLIERRGSMLFTHFGLSGPAPLDVSRAVTAQVRAQDVMLVADFLPDVTVEELEAQLRAAAAADGRRAVASIVAERLPRRLVDSLLQRAGIPAERRSAEFAKAERAELIAQVKRCEIRVTGSSGFEKAEVTAGGVELDEVDSRTMQSKLVPSLYLAGEILDLDGFIGGYNFQAAFSTGWLAGESV
jgi:predicted Rossmann fold flavoprotein